MQGIESCPHTRHFGVFEVDLRAAELRKRGVRIKLQEQPFRILSLLLEHPGEVVTREELREKLWPVHTFVDFDRSLNKAMTKLRCALADSAESPRYVETIPRHGYRFLAPVQTDPEGAEKSGDSRAEDFPHSDSHSDAGAVASAGPTAESGKGRARTAASRIAEDAGVASAFESDRLWQGLHARRFYLAACAVVVAIVAGFALRVYQPAVLEGSSAPVRPRRSIAVLGFK